MGERVRVALAVAPRLLRDTLSYALGRDDRLTLVDVPPDVSSLDSTVDVAVVTGRRPAGLRPPVVIELPARDDWTGAAWLEIGGLRRAVLLPTLDALADVVRDPHNGEDDFGAVLAAARARRQWALARLYGHLNPSLLRYIRSLAPDIADDLAADVWVIVVSRLHTFDGDEAGFRAWVFAIARNRVRGHYRVSGRRRTQPVPHGALDAHASADDVAEEALRRLPPGTAVSVLLEGLSDDMAEVVRLRVVAELTTAEVARVMGKSEGAVRVLQHRALRRLSQRFGAYRYGPQGGDIAGSHRGA